MAMSRVQYQAGLPMIEFFEKYGSHAQYEEVVKAWTKTRAIAATTLALGVFVIASAASAAKHRKAATTSG